MEVNGLLAFWRVQTATHINSWKPCLEIWKAKYKADKFFHWVLKKVDRFSTRWIFHSCDRAVFIMHSRDVCWVPTLCQALDMLTGANRHSRLGEQRHTWIHTYASAKTQESKFISTLNSYASLRSNCTNENPFITSSTQISKPLTWRMKTHFWPWPCSSANCPVLIKIR